MGSKDPIPAQASQARRFQLCRLGRALSFLQKPSLKPSQLSGPHRVRGHRFRNQGRGGRARILPENPKKEPVSPLGRRLVPGVLRLSWRAPRAPSGRRRAAKVRGVRGAPGGPETTGSLLWGAPHCPGSAAPARPPGSDCAPGLLPDAAPSPLSGARQPPRVGQSCLWPSSVLEK